MAFGLSGTWWDDLRRGDAPPARPRESLDALDNEVLAQAAVLLTTPSALAQLSEAEAELVVGYSQVRRFAAGDTVIAEGEREHDGVMYLIVDGDVTVEALVVSRTEPIVMTALGPGSLIGEMGLLDGAPRAASCIASTAVAATVLSREALARLILDHPLVGAKLLAAVSQRLAERLREGNQKLRAYNQLVRAMQAEIESLDPTPLKLSRRQ